MNETLSILVMVGGGLGTFLLGMKHLSEGLQAVSGSGLRRFKSFDATSVWGMTKCVLVSLVFTAVVQSSAATTAIAMTLAQQGLLSFEAADAARKLYAVSFKTKTSSNSTDRLSKYLTRFGLKFKEIVRNVKPAGI